MPTTYVLGILYPLNSLLLFMCLLHLCGICLQVSTLDLWFLLHYYFIVLQWSFLLLLWGLQDYSWCLDFFASLGFYEVIFSNNRIIQGSIKVFLKVSIIC